MRKIFVAGIGLYDPLQYFQYEICGRSPWSITVTSFWIHYSVTISHEALLAYDR